MRKFGPCSKLDLKTRFISPWEKNINWCQSRKKILDCLTNRQGKKTYGEKNVQQRDKLSEQNIAETAILQEQSATRTIRHVTGRWALFYLQKIEKKHFGNDSSCLRNIMEMSTEFKKLFKQTVKDNLSVVYTENIYEELSRGNIKETNDTSIGHINICQK